MSEITACLRLATFEKSYTCSLLYITVEKLSEKRLVKNFNLYSNTDLMPPLPVKDLLVFVTASSSQPIISCFTCFSYPYRCLCL